MNEAEVIVRLTVYEAVVLDDFLRRFSETDRLTIEDQSNNRHYGICSVSLRNLAIQNGPQLIVLGLSFEAKPNCKFFT